MLWNSWVLVICVCLTDIGFIGPVALADEVPEAATTTPTTDAALAVPPMTPENVASLADRIKKSVVVVSFSDRDGKTLGIGSGFIIREDVLYTSLIGVTIDKHTWATAKLDKTMARATVCAISWISAE